MPCVFFNCLILCIAQSSVAWYLPSLQPFLEQNFQLTTLATGAMFTVEGATYAAFSPLWGWLLDKWLSPWIALYVGNACVIIGYCLLGPSPLLPFIPVDVYVVGFSLCIMG
jgi:MFS family permease